MWVCVYVIVADMIAVVRLPILVQLYVLVAGNYRTWNRTVDAHLSWSHTFRRNNAGKILSPKRENAEVSNDDRGQRPFKQPMRGQ